MRSEQRASRRRRIAQKRREVERRYREAARLGGRVSAPERTVIISRLGLSVCPPFTPGDRAAARPATAVRSCARASARTLGGAARRELRPARALPEHAAREGAAHDRLRPALRARRGPAICGTTRGTATSTCSSGYGVFALGRNQPAVVAALREVLERRAAEPGADRTCRCSPGILAERLVATFPGGLDKVFFANSGAEAVEAAIKFGPLRDGPPAAWSLRARLPRAHHGRGLTER